MGSSIRKIYISVEDCNLSKIIVIGTCAGINSNYKIFDIIIPNKFVQYDCTIKELEPFIKDSFTVSIDLSGLSNVSTGTLGTADKPVVMVNNYLELALKNHVKFVDANQEEMVIRKL